MPKTINLNQDITIHLNDKGFSRLKEIIKDEYEHTTQQQTEDYIQQRKVGTTGYKDQLYNIMHIAGPLMFNGSPYLITTVCELHPLR